MLGKLIKNEFKATARNFLPIYLIMLTITVFLKVLLEIQTNAGIENTFIDILFGLLMITFILAIIAIFFVTAILIIKRFYDNMLKDEGYLSFTLPVTTGQHLMSKVLVGYAWMIVSFVIIVLSVTILFLGDGEFWEAIQKGFSQAIELVNANGMWHFVIEIIMICLIGLYANIMLGYTCFSVGQNFNKHRVVGAFITYMAIYIITQIVSSVFMVFLLNMDMSEEVSVMSDMFQPFMIYTLAFTLIEAVVFTVITYFMLSRRLNLE